VYFVSIIGILTLSLVVHFIDHKNVIADFFSISRFELVSYDTLLAVNFYNYRWWVFIGAVINTAVNFVWERVLI